MVQGTMWLKALSLSTKSFAPSYESSALFPGRKVLIVLPTHPPSLSEPENQLSQFTLTTSVDTESVVMVVQLLI